MSRPSERLRLGRRLPRRFFERPADVVARALVGCVWVTRRPSTPPLVARIVETEAYFGEGRDEASHAHMGPTSRNASMFGRAGTLYAYRSYGIHTCANVVCGAPGEGAAVLLRAAEPLGGIPEMARLRGWPGPGDRPWRELAQGPGRLARALDIRLEDDGTSLLSGRYGIFPAETQSEHASCTFEVECGPRIGITRAVDAPLRFFAQGHACVSRARPGRPGRRR